MAGRRSAEERKAQIVAQMLRLADEIGPDRLSTTDVARAVGISQPAIFRHFPTKGALWLAVAEEVLDRLQTNWALAETGASNPDARLKALIRAQLGVIESMPALPSILFSRELQVDNPALREVVQGTLGAFQARLVEAIRDSQAARGVRPDIGAVDAAIMLTSLVQGVAIRWTLGARRFSLVQEGLRLFDVQMALMRLTRDTPHD